MYKEKKKGEERRKKRKDQERSKKTKVLIQSQCHLYSSVRSRTLYIHYQPVPSTQSIKSMLSLYLISHH